MPNGLSSQPKVSRGALVDIDPIVGPPLVVPFQFNPESIQRKRSVTLREPAPRQGHETSAPPGQTLGEAQSTLAESETISLDIRLDATDQLERGDPVTGRFGVLPELSALELMVTPRPPSPFTAQLGLSADLGFSGQEATPVLVFVWGRYRVYAVRLTELSIQETEHSPDLNPTRVIVSVTLQVLAGGNPFTKFTAAQRALAVSNLVRTGSTIRSLINIG